MGVKGLIMVVYFIFFNQFVDLMILLCVQYSYTAVAASIQGCMVLF